MRSCAGPLFVAAVLAGLAGCGTVVNLMAPPTTTKADMLGLGLDTCQPFGGTKRSLVLGVGLGGVVAYEGMQRLGQGGLLMCAGGVVGGLAILAVDGPLSLAGDVVTWPIAYARQQQAPWATWWGEQSGQGEAKEDSLRRFWMNQPPPTDTPRAEDEQRPTTSAPKPAQASENP
jgi:hypothetical protein